MTDGTAGGRREAISEHCAGLAGSCAGMTPRHAGLKLAARFVYNPRLAAVRPSISG
jgi:hypothetical protein